jgi:hypothetical protein
VANYADQNYTLPQGFLPSHNATIRIKSGTTYSLQNPKTVGIGSDNQIARATGKYKRFIVEGTGKLLTGGLDNTSANYANPNMAYDGSSIVFTGDGTFILNYTGDFTYYRTNMDLYSYGPTLLIKAKNDYQYNYYQNWYIRSNITLKHGYTSSAAIKNYDLFFNGIFIENSCTFTGAENPWYTATTAPFFYLNIGRDVFNQATASNVFSEKFEKSGWTKTNCSVTANTTIAPNGTTTADTITTTGTASITYARPYSAGQFTTWSVFAKAGTLSSITIELNNGSGTNVGSATFDLLSGTITSVSNTGLSAIRARIEPNENGFYRCILVQPYASGVGSVYTPFIRTTGIGTYFLWGAADYTNADFAYSPTREINSGVDIGLRNAGTSLRIPQGVTWECNGYGYEIRIVMDGAKIDGVWILNNIQNPNSTARRVIYRLTNSCRDTTSKGSGTIWASGAFTQLNIINDFFNDTGNIQGLTIKGSGGARVRFGFGTGANYAQTFGAKFEVAGDFESQFDTWPGLLQFDNLLCSTSGIVTLTNTSVNTQLQFNDLTLTAMPTFLFKTGSVMRVNFNPPSGRTVSGGIGVDWGTTAAEAHRVNFNITATIGPLTVTTPPTNAKVNVATGVTLTVASLTIGGVSQSAGSYTASTLTGFIGSGTVVVQS